MLRLQTIALSLLGGLGIGGGVLLLLSPEPAPQLLLEGSVFEINAESPTAREMSLRQAIELRAKQLLDHEVYLSAGLESYPLSAQKLGYTIDQEEAVAALGVTLDKAIASQTLRHRLLARLLQRPVVIRGQLPLTLVEERARPTMENLTVLVDRPPEDAQMLVAEHEIVPSKTGQRLSVEASLLRLAHSLEPAARQIELSIEQLEPTITEQQLAPVDVTRVLASFETSFKGKAGARAVNIRAAGSYLNGAVLMPGEVLSFNEHVGRRVHGRGFVDAPVIVNDELEQDVGGGVCQVATTLHGAAVFGNLEVVHRRSHSRPSGYAALGLDATVIDGKVDLRLRNPYDEPLLVYVSFPSTYVIRVELLGRDPTVRVRHDYSVTHREAFARRVWRRSELSGGEFEKKQKGIEGMDVVSVLAITHPDGRVEKRRYTSKYYPVPEVFWVGEDASLSQLPPAGSEIAAVVVDGEPIDAPLTGATANETGEEVPPLSGAREVL